MVEILTILINDEDFTKYADRDNLRIRMEIKNYSAELELFLPINLLHKVQPSVKLEIVKDNENIFGGLIYNVKYGKLITHEDVLKREVSLNIETYNIIPTRRTISGILDLEPTDPDNPGNDKNTAGRLFRRYIDKFLCEEGIEVGEIGEGARLADKLELYEWDTMSIKEIYDILSSLTGDNWHIDINKKLHFALSEFLSVLHDAEEFKIIEANKNYWGLKAEKSLDGYINKIFVRGDYPDEELTEEWLDYDGKIKYSRENNEEILRMKTLNKDSGVWGKVIKEEMIEYLETAERRAEIEMKKYGKMPITVKVYTLIDIFNPGDQIPVELPTCDILLDNFTVKSIDIEFNEAKELVHHLELINNEIIDDTVFSDIVAKQDSKINNTNNNNDNDDGGDGGPVDPEKIDIPIEGLVTWVDMQDESKVVLYESSFYKGTHIENIIDKFDNSSCFSFGDTSPLFFKRENKTNYMTSDFLTSSINYNESLIDLLEISNRQFVGDKSQGQSIFMVYKDRTISEGTRSKIESTRHNEEVEIDGEAKYEAVVTVEELIVEYPGNYTTINPLGGIHEGDYLLNTSEFFGELLINNKKVNHNTQKRVRNNLIVASFLTQGASLTLGAINYNHELDDDVRITTKDLYYAEDYVDINGFEHNNVYVREITERRKNINFVGDIAEMIIYDRNLSSQEVDKVNNYLMDKYNII